MSPPPEDPDARRERRAWIRAHHPDRGGDPARFADGLARFARDDVPDPVATTDRPTVYRSRRPGRRARRMLVTIRQRITKQPRSRRLL